MQTGFRRALDGLVFCGALATIPLVILLEQKPLPAWVQVADWAVWSVFVIEYVALLIAAPNRLRYVRRTPIHLLVVLLSLPSLPVLLGLVRLARLARFVRLLRVAGVTARGIVGLKAILTRRGFVYVALTASVVVLAGGTGLALLEPETVRGRFLDGICWALFTVTTVGYSDITPATVWGRLIGVVLMLTSVGLVSTLAASITATFLGHEEGEDLREIKERVIRIELLLANIAADQAQSTHSNVTDGEPDTVPRIAPVLHQRHQ
jgi:voltage-gated potassium channel